MNQNDTRIKEQLKLSREGFNPLTMSPAEMERFHENIKGLQVQYQIENCPKCDRYDTSAKYFKEMGHPNNPQDCKYHWTDIVGDCWNFKERK